MLSPRPVSVWLRKIPLTYAFSSFCSLSSLALGSCFGLFLPNFAAESSVLLSYLAAPFANLASAFCVLLSCWSLAHLSMMLASRSSPQRRCNGRALLSSVSLVSTTATLLDGDMVPDSTIWICWLYFGNCKNYSALCLHCAGPIRARVGPLPCCEPGPLNLIPPTTALEASTPVLWLMASVFLGYNMRDPIPHCQSNSMMLGWQWLSLFLWCMLTDDEEVVAR